MAFPTIPTVAAGRVLSTNQADASGTRTFPSLSSLTKNSGDLLIAIVIAYQSGGSSGAVFSSWGGGFTELSAGGDQMTTSGSTMCIGIAYKWSDGTETGTFNVTQASPTGHATLILLSIPGAHASTPPEAGTVANGTAAAADPGSFNPAGWGTEDTLWIALAASGMTSGTGSWTGTGTTAPANYTDRVDSNTTDNSTVGQTEGAVAFRQLNAASEDIGTAGVDTSNARNSALVIAVRPAPSSTDLGHAPITAPLSVVAPSFALSLELGHAPLAAPLVQPTATLSLVSELGHAPVTTPLAVVSPTLGLGASELGHAPLVAVLAEPSPTFQTPHELAPSPVPSTLVVPAPAVVQLFELGHAPVSVAVAQVAPLLELALAFAPDPLAAPLVVPAPAVDLPLTLILDPVAAVVAVPNPTIDTGGGSPTTLEPDPVAVAIALPSPTVGLLLAFAPAPVAAAVAVPGPTIEIGPLALAPTSVALLLTVPGPTLSGDQADLLEDSFAEVAVAATGSATTALSQGAYAEVDLR